ncbi:MAG: penicillin-binding protein 2 [Planctomycetota bacterium]|nr:penicillin-binding protein 2 [Planctomycetota bacterium]
MTEQLISRGEKARAVIFAIVLASLLGGLIYRLYVIQIENHEQHLQTAHKQHRRSKNLKPWRGDIFLRENDKNVLVAGSIGQHSLMVHGRQKNPDDLVKSLTEILKLDGKERSHLRDRLARGRSFWFQRRKVTHTQASALKKGLKKLVAYKVPGKKKPRYKPMLAGFDVVEESARIYPFDSLASHILGLVNGEGKGCSGVEASFNEQLKGLSGLEEFEIDNRRAQLTNLNTVSVPALPGYNLVLTIDRRVQYFVEEALDEAAKHWTPEGISVVAVDPSTGRILAMASRPNFNPEDPGATPMANMRNRVLTDPYEPGSTIKALLTSYVWQLGRGDPKRPMNLPRSLRVKGRRKPILDSHKVRVKDRGTQERDLIIQSSNVGSYLMSLRLNDDEFRSCLKIFGLGARTGVPLSGEAPGNLALTRKLNTGNRAALAQGYGLMVTPLQMVMAYSAIANGGTLFRPRLAYQLIDHEGKVARTFEPRMVARVLSHKVSRDWMSEALAGVVGSRHGTARRCRIKGYSMAGKTGTSKKLVKDGDKRSWHYSPTRTVCSFIGFAPVENPRIAIAVVVNDPNLKHGRVFGGNVAAPIASKVIEQSLQYWRVPRKIEEPKVKGKKVTSATRSGASPSKPKPQTRRRPA